MSDTDVSQALLDVAQPAAEASTPSGAAFWVFGLMALLMGFEVASLRRWIESRRKWRQLDVVVATNEQDAEWRFFDRWTAKQRALANDQSAVDRGRPPPMREISGQPFSRPSSPPGIVGMFPQPGAST